MKKEPIVKEVFIHNNKSLEELLTDYIITKINNNLIDEKNE